MVKRRIMRALKINEISAVDTPAQSPALAAIMKRKGYPTVPGRKKGNFEVDFDKSPDGEGITVLLTDPEDGHQHAVWIHSGQTGGSTSHNGMDNDAMHAHQWVMDAQGNITIGLDHGHDHGGVISADELVQALMAMAAGRLADEAADMLGKREFSTEQREKLAEEGKAMPDGSFPIATAADLKNAVSAFGRAKDKSKVARHIARRAEALDATDELPTEGRLATLIGKSDNARSEAAGDGGGSKAEENVMPNTDKSAAELEAAEKLEKAERDLALAKAYGALSDIEKAHYAGLDETEQGAFLSLDAAGRTATIEKANADKEANESVVYKADDGTVYTKADDPRIVAMAKNTDAVLKQNASLVKAAAENGLRKRAEDEFGALPGTVETRMALIKAADSIPDKDEREQALEALKSQNDIMAKALTVYGYTGDGQTGQVDASTFIDGMPVPVGVDPFGKTAEQGAFEKGVAEFHKNHADLTVEQATLKFAETPEGSQLYTAHTNAHAARASQYN